MLKLGADINLQDYTATTPLKLAFELNHLDIMELLMKKEADVNKGYGAQLSTLLHIAAESCQLEKVKLLVNYNAKVDCLTKSNETAFYISLNKGNFCIAQFLIHHGADLSKELSTRPLLVLAAQNGNLNQVTFLVKNNVDLELVDKTHGGTALFIAAKHGHSKVVKYLLESKAKIEVKCTDNSWTPLHIASYNGHTNVVKILLQYEAQINVKSKAKETPLFLAVKQSRVDVVELLVSSKGIKINEETESKNIKHTYCKSYI